MFDRFHDDAKRTMFFARQAVLQFGHDAVDTEHLLVGLCEGQGRVASGILRELGVDPKSVRPEVEKLVTRGEATTTGPVPFTPALKSVLELSMDAAVTLCHSYIGSEHLLVGLIAEGNGIGARVLAKLGVEAQAVKRAIARFPPSEGTPAVRTVLQQARAEALKREHNEVDIPHLLLALLQPQEGFVAKWLAEAGLNREALRESVRRALDGSDPST